MHHSYKHIYQRNVFTDTCFSVFIFRMMRFPHLPLFLSGVFALRLVSVDPHMPIEITRLRKPQKAKFTLIRFFSTVYSQVFGQGRTVGKRFFAQTTPVWPIPRMGAHVSGDRRTLREAPVTDWTAERLLAGVRPDMRSKIGSLGERLATRAAFVRLFTRMRAKVSLKRRRSGVRLTTDATQVGLQQTLVSRVVSRQMGYSIGHTSHPDNHSSSPCAGDRHGSSGCGYHRHFVGEEPRSLAQPAHVSVVVVLVDQVMVGMSDGTVTRRIFKRVGCRRGFMVIHATRVCTHAAPQI